MSQPAAPKRHDYGAAKKSAPNERQIERKTHERHISSCNREAGRLAHEAGVLLHTTGIRKSSYAAQGAFRAAASFLWSVLCKNQQARQEAAVAAGNGPADP